MHFKVDDSGVPESILSDDLNYGLPENDVCSVRVDKRHGRNRCARGKSIRATIMKKFDVDEVLPTKFVKDLKAKPPDGPQRLEPRRSVNAVSAWRRWRSRT